MRVRIRFAKHAPLQYIGHLDVMRYFQKAIRRAELPVRYSEGFSPHILMSFASPLGVGKISDGEYFDLEMQEYVPAEEILRRLEEQMAPGMDVTGAAYVEESKKTNAMRVIAAASYTIGLPEGVPDFTEEQVRDFLAREKIEILRKTKKKEEVTDIRPWIYACEPGENGLSMLLSAGSVRNLKPELVLCALADMYGVALPDTGMVICRKELYADTGTEGERRLVPLLECGRIPEEEVRA